VEDLHVDVAMRNEVLLRVEAAGLCHSDLHYMEAKFRTRVPTVLGHESAGIVEAVGTEVDYVVPGDHVVCCTSVFCGRCRQCLSGHPYRCTNTAETMRRPGERPRLARHDGSAVHQFSHLGGFAEMMLVHENTVVKVRPDVPFDVAAILGCAVLTGTGAVFRSARVEPGSRVCVVGVGGIGLAAIQAARIAGAAMIVAVDVSEDKLQLARRLGATHTVNSGQVEDVVKEVQRIAGGGVDNSFEAIGLKSTAEQAFRMLDIGGTATVIGMVPSNQPIEVQGTDLLLGRTLQGSMMGSNQFRHDIPRLVGFYLDGRLRLNDMISHRLSLDDINECYDQISHGEVTRAVVTF
jgi:S-(hydroxymethyl)glutathione dehydrogenase/alcohol dehydrogenase